MGLAPVVVLAQVGETTGGTVGGVSRCLPVVGQLANSDLVTFICRIGDVLSTVVPVLIVLGVLYFVWGVITYVIASDEEAKKAGRDRMIFGIIGLAVIIALWGLVRILTNTFGVSNSGQSVTFPTTPY